MKFITPYNTEWPARFNRIARFLRKYIPDTCLIHHIGSTSVPGMPAKDIIDIDIECPDGSMPSIIEALDKADYDHEGDLGIPTREAFKPRDGTLAFELPHHHLYACESHSPELFKHITFRDYLVSHWERARWLASQKIKEDKSASNRAEYIEKKFNAYEIITTESLSWAKDRMQQRRKNRAADA